MEGRGRASHGIAAAGDVQHRDIYPINGVDAIDENLKKPDDGYIRCAGRA